MGAHTTVYSFVVVNIIVEKGEIVEDLLLILRTFNLQSELINAVNFATSITKLLIYVLIPSDCQYIYSRHRSIDAHTEIIDIGYCLLYY